MDYYSTTDKYIRSKPHSNAHRSVFTKENDKYQWLVLEQKSQTQVEVRQTDNHGTITARDNYELTRNLPKCVSVERLCKDVNMQIPFNADKRQRYKADCKHHIEESKCPVRRNVCGTNRHCLHKG